MQNISLNLPRPRWNVIAFTLILHLGALLALSPAYFSWSAVGVALFLHWLTIGVGISLGFHRLASHRSFKTPKWFEYCLILCGTLAGQGAVIGWVGYHRMHHRFVDRTGDPHDSTQGFWWSHISWLMHTVPMKSELRRFTKDIADDRFYQFCHQHYIALQIVLAVLLYSLGGMPFVVWGIFARLFIGFHSTCFVNSACHQFGYRNVETSDRSTNCWWVAILTFGEGWHNNHHASQASARFGWQWWEIDLVWWMIRGFEQLGLAKNVKVGSSCPQARR
ncbi:fatty acid desaturase [Pseudanabaenaceae cyanobacterium LEGE 13415]|nr:fatty acid desaturase [Pseudanabaenaceae cyanobacterium LEGE 13415]